MIGTVWPIRRRPGPAALAVTVMAAAALAAGFVLLMAVTGASAAPSPFGVGLPEAAASPSGPFAGVFRWVARQQSAFYQALTEALKALKADGSAGWWLAGLSFLYGVFHAAGPGHGKAVISAWVLANRETLLRGIALSFASAFAQAVTAIVLVGVAAVILNLTSVAITETTRLFEIGSYAAVTALGLMLVWSKILRPVIAGRRPRSLGAAVVTAHDHHDHHLCHTHDAQHDHLHHQHHDTGEVCPSCGHVHAPDPGMLSGALSLRKAWSVVLAVGLRPCTGALIVLVFALAQSLALAGVMATFAMALGTGLTVSVLAALAVGAKGAALKVAGSGSAAIVHRVVEAGGAILVLLLGMTLLVAALGFGG